MQTAFFEIAKLIPPQVSIEAIKKAIQKTYASKGEKVVRMNLAAVDAAIKGLQKVEYPTKVTSKFKRPPVVPDEAPDLSRPLRPQSFPARVMNCR